MMVEAMAKGKVGCILPWRTGLTLANAACQPVRAAEYRIVDKIRPVACRVLTAFLG